MPRLLILKCSSRKRGGDDLLPAIDRYDGPLWQVLRSRIRERPSLAEDVDIYVLSAAFGLISAITPIPWYDQTMAPERAEALRPEALRDFAVLMEHNYNALCVGLSKRYLHAMLGWEDLVPPDTAVTVTDGPMGTKLGQLRAWLEGDVWQPPTHSVGRLAAAKQPRGEAVLAGVPLRMTKDEVLDRARQALASDDAGAGRYRDWYVLIDGRPVAAKWIAALISGVPTSRFDAARARSALLALGVDVERVSPAERPQ